MEEDEAIRTFYPQITVKELAWILRRGEPAIYQRASQLGLSKAHPAEWSMTDLEYLIEHWPNTPSQIICQRLQRSYGAVSEQAQRLRLRKIRIAARNTVNSSAFAQLDSETSYLLGVLMADGNVSDAGRIILAMTDRECVEHAKRILQASHNVGCYQPKGGKPQYTLTINDKPMAHDLSGWGVIPRKSMVATWPEVDDALLPHLVRGYFDGDGNAHFHQRGALSVNIVSGSRQLIVRMQERICETTSLPAHPVRQHKSVWCLKFYGPNALRFADWMYADAGNLFIPRKRRAFAEYELRAGRPSLHAIG